MENTEYKKYSGLKDYLNHEVEEEENELDKSCLIIQKDISEIQKDLRSCNSVEEKCEIRKRAFYSLECIERIERNVKPLSCLSHLKGSDAEISEFLGKDHSDIEAFKYFHKKSYLSLKNELNKIIEQIESKDISLTDFGDPNINFKELHGELSKYISEVSVNELKHIIVKKKLSDGASKAKWIFKTRTEAWRFLNYVEMEVAEFNQSFIMPGNKPLRGNNKDYKEMDTELICILKKYIKK